MMRSLLHMTQISLVKCLARTKGLGTYGPSLASGFGQCQAFPSADLAICVKCNSDHITSLNPLNYREYLTLKKKSGNLIFL